MTLRTTPALYVNRVEALLLTVPESVAEAQEVNKGFIEIFGIPLNADSHSLQFKLGMPFEKKYDGALIKDEPTIEHQAFLEPLLNPGIIVRSVLENSPFNVQTRKLPLLGIAYPVRSAPSQSARVTDVDPAHSLHFYVRANEKSPLITTIVAKRGAIVTSGGKLAVDVTSSAKSV